MHEVLLQVLVQTPPWVFAIFLALLALGFQQSRTRTVSRKKLLLPPVALIGFSLYSVATSFGSIFLPLLAWSMGLVVAVGVGARIPQTPAQQVEPGVFLVKGSWWPLALMMVIFSIQYAMGYAAARDPTILLQLWFVGVASTLLGLLSGAFLLRARAAVQAG